ncbi:putative EMP1-like protein, partial [Plasmodium gaboni]
AVKNICDLNYYDSFIRKSKLGNPCKINTIKGKGWICDGTSGGGGEKVKTEWTNKACMPGRTQVLCLGFMGNKEHSNYYHDASSVIDSSQKLLTELIYAANVEGQNLKNHFASCHQGSGGNNLCNALKYSFSDLGDIVRGRSIWENGYTQNMENNLRAIFHNIYNN